MNPRARRIALLTVAAGCLVAAALVAFNWPTVRDHAEAWWFQATNKTWELPPLPPGVTYCLRYPFQDLADQSCQLVIMPHLDGDCLKVDDREPLGALVALREAGFRIVKQSFPQQAYVVVGYPPEMRLLLDYPPEPHLGR
jgi:hypothetical protein